MSEHRLRPRFTAGAVAAWLLAAGAYPLLAGGPPRRLLLAASLLCVLSAWLAPHWWLPPARGFSALGRFIGRCFAGTLLAGAFWGVITPVACLLRWGGRDVLRLRKLPAEVSFWVEPAPRSMTLEQLQRQF